MLRVSPHRALPVACLAALLLAFVGSAGAAGGTLSKSGQLGAGTLALLRSDGRPATISPQQLAVRGGKANGYALFNLPSQWVGKQLALTLTAQRSLNVTISAVHAGRLSSLRWRSRPARIGSSVSALLPAARSTVVALPVMPATRRLVLQISARGKGVIASRLQLAPVGRAALPTGAAGGTDGNADSGASPAAESPAQPGNGPAAPSDPGATPNDPPPAAPSIFDRPLPRLIGAPTVGAAAITEASGLAASLLNEGVYWTHNDSGDRARLFAIDAATGALRATLELPGVTATDWEDLAIAPGPDGNDAFFIADIGDNAAARSSVKVYRTAEPQLPAAGGAPITINAGSVATQRLTYPGGPRDAESLAVGSDRALTVVSKREAQVGVYSLADPPFNGATAQLNFAGRLPLSWAVGASASADGSFILLKTANAIHGYLVDPDQSVAAALVSGGGGADLPLSVEPQGESVAVSTASDGYATLSEGLAQPLNRWAW